MVKKLKQILILAPLCLSSCTTINVDYNKVEENLTVNDGDTVIILGRHHSAEFETEPSLVSCIGRSLDRKSKIKVLPHKEFTDAFYPWFEARTAPLKPKKLQLILDQPNVMKKFEELNVRYFIWVEGSTEKTNSAGSMTCAASVGAAGCFGFGMWEDTSDYETTIWDVNSMKEAGRISTDAVGTSYIPAIVVPIPLLARVEKDACRGMATQLASFFNNDSTTQLKRLAK